MEGKTPIRSLTLEEGIILTLQQAWELSAFKDGFGLDQSINLNLPVLALGLVVDGEVIATWGRISNLVQSCLKLTLLGKPARGVVLNVFFLLTLFILQSRNSIFEFLNLTFSVFFEIIK